jgi:putative ABC transport system ATP-binding protein
MLLQLINVSKTYKIDSLAVQALKKINLAIKKGEFIAIMGPSGSGKSTLMHLAGCLDTPTTGKILLEGEDISKLSEAKLAKIRNKKIGFVFQAFNLIPRTTALDNVSLPLLYSNFSHQEMKKEAVKALKSVNLGDRLNHFPNQLSGGEQQRVAIARALVNQPAIIFADEPTGNLDTKAGAEIMKILKKLNDQGHTVVVVTHELHIGKFAKRIIKIVDGEIVNEST